MFLFGIWLPLSLPDRCARPPTTMRQRRPLKLKPRPWALWRSTQQLRATHLSFTRTRRTRLHRQVFAIPGGRSVVVLHDLQECEQWDDDAHASTLDRSAHGGTCGSVVWTSSTALVSWLGGAPDRLRSLVAGASVLELGAGVGFVGTALARMGAARTFPGGGVGSTRRPPPGSRLAGRAPPLLPPPSLAAIFSCRHLLLPPSSTQGCW